MTCVCVGGGGGGVGDEKLRVCFKKITCFQGEALRIRTQIVPVVNVT